MPMAFPDLKCFVFIPHPTISPHGLFVALCYWCKGNKVLNAHLLIEMLSQDGERRELYNYMGASVQSDL